VGQLGNGAEGTISTMREKTGYWTQHNKGRRKNNRQRRLCHERETLEHKTTLT
jgi:hypothetical protein